MRTRNSTHRRRRLVVGLFAMAVMPAAAAPQEPPAALSALLIEEVAAESKAAKAGLEIGDRILRYDGKTLSSPPALQALEDNTLGKDTVVLQIQRAGEVRTTSAPLGTLGIQVRPELSPVALTEYEAGRAAQRIKELDEVIVRWTAAAEAEEGVNAAAAAWLHGRVGETLQGQQRWKDACVAYDRAWALAKETHDPALQSRALRALGRCRANLSDFSAAERWHAQARQTNEASGNAVWAAGSIDDLGNVALARGDLSAARDYHERALRLFEQLVPGSQLVAASLNNLAMTTARRGDLAAAEGYYGRSLAILERLTPGSRSVAAVLNNMGVVANDRGDLEASHKYLTRSLEIVERLGSDSLDVANGLTNLGNVAIDRGELAAAEDYNRRALTIRERLIPNSLPMAISLNNLAIVARSRGELAVAEDYHRRALSIREQVAPNSLDVAASLNNLGNVVRDRGDLAAAETYHRRSLAIKERVAPNSLSMAASFNALGNLLRDRGDLAAAEDFHTRALVLRERLAPNSLDVATSLNNLGLLAAARGETAAALDHYARALVIREKLAPDSLAVAESLENRGHVDRDRGNQAAAQSGYQRALAIRERMAPTSLNMAGTLNSLGGIALKDRRFADALPLFSRAVEIIEAQRSHIVSAEARALLLAGHTESYAGLLRTQVALDDLPAAFATAERAHARSLLEILIETRADIRQGVDPALLERERLLQQELNAAAERQTRLLGRPHTDEQAAAVKKALDASLAQYQGVQAMIRVESPRYSALMQPAPLGLRELQREVLDDNTLLLEYVLGDESSHLFAVTPTSIVGFDLPARAAIEKAARRVYELLVARQPVKGETPAERTARIAQADADYPIAAESLSQMVLGPMSGQLASKRLLIVADGALQYVPFAVLPEPGSPDQTTREPGQPLIVNHEVVNLPSASILAVMRREPGHRQRPTRLVAVLADPVFSSEDARLKTSRPSPRAASAAASLPADVERAARSARLLDDRGSLARLPFTRDEADAILALAPRGQGTRAVDFRANRATATSADLSDYRVVHLATHGLLDAEHPELSGIVLSLVDEQGAAQDGFLRLHEVYNLNWSAELVVLSACQTALGKEIRGEGLVGLTRGFMYAGAERVLASLWNVNDGATAQFMKRFYRGLFTEGLRPAAALRAAQVEMRNRQAWRAPYYWAAFALQGEWK